MNTSDRPTPGDQPARTDPSFLIDWFLPDAILRGDETERFRGRLVVVTSLGMSLLSAVAMSIVFVIRQEVLWLLLGASVLPQAAIPFVLKQTRSLTLAASLLVGQVLLSVSLHLLVSGAWDASLPAWISVAPLIAGFLVGRRALFVTSLIALVYLVLSGLLVAADVLPVAETSDLFGNFLNVVVLLIFVAAFGRLYQRDQETARVRAKAAISDLKSVNRELQEARDLAEAGSRAKMEFLARMSHEIRTPMSGVLGMNELLLQSELDPEQRHYAQVVRKSAKSLLSIIDDVLDFSRLGAGELRIENADYDPREPLEHAVSLLAAAAHRKGLEFSARVDPDVPRRTLGASDRIHQVLVNLLSNAIKYTERGSIGVKVSRATGRGGQNLVRFEVADTGPGFTPRERSRVFEPFFQIDSSTTRRHPGTGLGLAICQELVGKMSGEIGVESEEGRGSTFWFSVPMKDPVRRNDADLDWGDRLAGCRVLWVGGESMDRESARVYLEGWGASFNSVDSMEDVEESGKGHHDVVLVDAGLESAASGRSGDYAPVDGARPILVIPPGTAVEKTTGRHSRRLRKPLLERPLLSAVCGALRLDAPSWLLQDEWTELETPTVRDQPVGDVRVLVVEDNEVSRALIVGVLRQNGYQVDVAGNGIEALDLIASNPYSVVLLDCQMPELDGYDTAASIRRSEEGRADRVPIVAVTAHALAEERKRCLDAGMDDFLSKPYFPEQLVAMVEKWGSGPVRPGPSLAG